MWIQDNGVVEILGIGERFNRVQEFLIGLDIEIIEYDFFCEGFVYWNLICYGTHIIFRIYCAKVLQPIYK